MGGVFSGQALGGIFASSMNILFLWLGGDVVSAAFSCFVIAVAFLLTALIGYIIVTRSKFFKHFLREDTDTKKEEPMTIMSPTSEGDQLMGQKPHIPVKVNPLKIFLRIFFYGISVFLIFTVTLACFPALTALVVSTNFGSGDPWSDIYFVPVTCLLLFNVGDYFGRLVAEFLRWPRPGKFGMFLIFALSIARIAFVPLFLFCNLTPDNRELTGVYFTYDYVYIIIMVLFSLTNGYLSSICMMSAPQICQEEEAQTAASLMVALLGLGLGAGSACSMGLVKLL